MNADRGKEAIASIPNYVERAAFFVCVAGAWRHESGALRDVRAWCARGWCRMELLCNLLSPEAKPHSLAPNLRRMCGVMGRPGSLVEIDHQSRGPRRIYSGGGPRGARPRHRALNRRADGCEAGGGYRGRAAMAASSTRTRPRYYLAPVSK